MGKHISAIKKGQILGLMRTGVSSRAAAKEFGVNKSVASLIFEKFKCGQELTRTPGSGRPRKTTPREDRVMIKAIMVDRAITIDQLRRENGLMHISNTTVGRRIEELTGMSSYWKSLKPFINEFQRKRRVLWCKYRLKWTREQWRKVIWSDESPFTLHYNRRTRCWRRSDERFKPFAMRGTLKHDTKIMVWGCFAAHGVGRIHWIKDIMDQHIYKQVLIKHLNPSIRKLFPRGGHTFQQDNDPKHTAKSIQDYLQSKGNVAMEWPGQSPDLNPIENLWSILNARMSERQCKSKEELFEVVKEAWESIPVDTLERLVDSMPRRLQAVIDNKGYPTKY